ncbi:MAG: DUF296 domain-containing protein [Candidatus Thermoplasmatota archaeon]|nr:DUF296 domain-containing protein [Candidatus Thermoplasmatota archaeon]
MQIKEEGNVIVAKFVEGNAIKNLEKLAIEQDIQSAAILSGIGMLKNAVAGYFDGRKYIEKKIEGAAELVSMQGNIGKDGEDNIICHIHVALAPPDHRLIGGHLLDGEVHVVNEIILQKLKDIKIRRERNSDGLMEMRLK